MYIQRHMLWWFLPIAVTLFLSGAIVAKWQNSLQSATEPLEVVIESKSAEQRQREEIRLLLAPLLESKSLAISVETGGQQWRGQVAGDSFTLVSKTDEHEWMIKRTEHQMTATVDGVEQEADALSYSLFTPAAHAKLITAQSEALQPAVLSNEQGEPAGYRISIPAARLTQQLAAWLGPAFSEGEVADALKQASLIYELYVEPNTKELTRMSLSITGLSAHEGKKPDELIFRF